MLRYKLGTFLKRLPFIPTFLLLCITINGCNNQTPDSSTTKRATSEPFRIPLHEAYKDNPARNFVIYVSNQSFEITPVDIEILIDDEVVASNEFDVGDQHSWYTYGLRLSEGKHKLQVKSVKGETQLEQVFEVSGQQWSVLEYWYYPVTHPNPTSKQFTWRIQNKPLMIE